MNLDVASQIPYLWDTRYRMDLAYQDLRAHYEDPPKEYENRQRKRFVRRSLCGGRDTQTFILM